MPSNDRSRILGNLLKTFLTGESINFSHLTKKLTAAKAVKLHQRYLAIAERLFLTAKSATGEGSSEQLLAISKALVELLFTGRLFEACYSGGNLEDLKMSRLLKFSVSFTDQSAANTQINLATNFLLARLPESGLFQKIIQSVDQARAAAQAFVFSSLAEVKATFDGPAFLNKPGVSYNFEQVFIARLQVVMLDDIKNFEADAAQSFDQANGIESLFGLIADIIVPIVYRCVLGALTYGADEDLAFEAAKAELKKDLGGEEHYLSRAFEIFEEQLDRSCERLVDEFEGNTPIAAYLAQIQKAATALIQAVDLQIKAEFELDDDE